MNPIVSSKVEQNRVSKWLMQAQPVDEVSTWTEKRLVIEFGGHVYLVVDDQVFQCAHCGHHDPQWSSSNVLTWFKEMFGVKPYEIEVTVSFKP